MSYLGPKGYSIYKNSITVNEQQFIRKELSVKPYIPQSTIQPPSFEIFRESNQKIYIPRFFGNSLYGTPEENRISDSIPINCPFEGELRDYQNKIVNTYYKTAHEKGGGLIEIGCGRGKTVMALKIISMMKVKTIVIVHKSFLLNQWLERIEQFLPNAKVGRIQGQTLDIEDKDIVIGMLQSLSMKSYPPELFGKFGLTIVDEVHHIAAEVFVRSLFKIVTPYVLGLSATMERKDGLTKVFKMFLGEIMYKEENKEDHNVIVKAMDYKVEDEDFNEIVYDYRGNPLYSTMISKLCNYSHRSEFILKILENLYKENNEQQIMILGHNKCLLVYLFKAIEERNFASVGYYVGGMKEIELKKSESKNIIIATYSMASEALDIKTLTTLIMATPKTDVTQSIGRILRTKHGNPLVIDIIDTHEIFRNQWKKRLTYYRKQKYTVYLNNELTNDPSKIVTKKQTKKCMVNMKGLV